ncbi:hypothetical protein SCLCIDRAFT_1216944 [Scleroderma citrinum Foug A]|uniref:Protein kinase domain-containing protein n=1 Tax=Scleroderma citrinum Foug A TaxID=1036808 RepID=A0A0C3A6E0_9AGAM|nr:hypothetical protein SCLCIDRAFT_1216944 [Scleroderma citrinum Foug A]
MLVANDGRTLLTNFSCSAIFYIDRAPISVGAIRWRAPEHVDDSRGVTMEGDVWAFGMTVLSDRLMDGEWWAVCTSCWGLDPASRPAMSVLVEKIEKIIAQSSRPRFVETLNENEDKVVNEGNA